VPPRPKPSWRCLPGRNQVGVTLSWTDAEASIRLCRPVGSCLDLATSAPVARVACGALAGVSAGFGAVFDSLSPVDSFRGSSSLAAVAACWYHAAPPSGSACPSELRERRWDSLAFVPPPTTLAPLALVLGVFTPFVTDPVTGRWVISPGLDTPLGGPLRACPLARNQAAVVRGPRAGVSVVPPPLPVMGPSRDALRAWCASHGVSSPLRRSWTATVRRFGSRASALAGVPPPARGPLLPFSTTSATCSRRGHPGCCTRDAPGVLVEARGAQTRETSWLPPVCDAQQRDR
jgi:hypothetical protein